MDPGSIVIGGMSAALLIPIIINLAKTYGLPDKPIPLIAVLMGIGFAFLAEWARVNPDVAWAVTMTVTGIMLGLGAMGYRSANKFYEGEANQAQLKQTAQEDQTTTTATVTASPEGVTKTIEVEPAGTPAQPVTIDDQPVRFGGTPKGGQL